MCPSTYESTGKGKYPYATPLLVETNPQVYLDSVCPNCRMSGHFLEYEDPRLTARNIYVLCGSCKRVYRVWDWKWVQWKYLTYKAHDWDQLERGR